MGFSFGPLTGPYVPPGLNHRGRVILWITWPQMILAIFMLLLRGTYAGTLNGRWRWDFTLAAGAVTLGFVAQILVTVSCIDGIGHHILDLGSFAEAAPALELYYASALICLYAIGIAKGSFISLLFSVWCPWQKKRRILLHVLWISNFAITIIQTALTLNQCHPQAMTFDYSITTGECNIRYVAIKWNYFHGAWNVATDLVLALYPILIMRDIKADLRTKVGFCVLMGGGFITAIACTFRTVYTHRLAVDIDTTYETFGSIVCGSTELWLICNLSAIPPLKPLWLRLLGWNADTTFADPDRSDGTTQPELTRAMSRRPEDALFVDAEMAERGDTAVGDGKEMEKEKEGEEKGGITMRSSVRVSTKTAEGERSTPKSSEGWTHETEAERATSKS